MGVLCFDEITELREPDIGTVQLEVGRTLLDDIQISHFPPINYAMTGRMPKWFTRWLIQKPTQNKNSQPYAARSCLTWNKRGSY